MIYADMEEVLTPSQQTCLRLVAKQMTSKEIARELGLSPHTVDAHIKAAMRRLGVTRRSEAAQLLEGGGEASFTVQSRLVWRESGEEHMPPGGPERPFPPEGASVDVDYHRPFRRVARPDKENRASESVPEKEWRIRWPEKEDAAPDRKGNGADIAFWQWGLIVLGVSLFAANLFVTVVTVLRP